MNSLLLFSGPCTEQTAAEVRRTLASAPVTALLPAALREDLILAATELLTNAVRAGATTVDVALDVAPGQVELKVADDAPGRPRRRQPALSDVHGRGLQILDAVAAQWGHRPAAGRAAAGKTVWARFALRG